MTDTTIAIIGGGNLGKSIALGLHKANFTKGSNILITRRRVHLINDLKEIGIQTSDDNIGAVKKANIIILAVKPNQVKELLKSLKPALNSTKQIIISVVTGVEIKAIKEITGEMPIFRAMPNTAIAIQESMTCLAFQFALQPQIDLVLEMFNHLGKTVIINEELMSAATVIGASGIAFALRFIRAVSQGGIEIGFGSEISQLITAQTVKGAADLILHSGNHPEHEIDKVTTPQGITISGLNEMEHQGFSPSIIKGLLTSFHKIET
ncbi:MAG: pyrroline-5-carboxylate reductase [Bacteroidales bacterium]|nr:pyrroline-5-carboxylate reductase [Bacteroidales bacterium]